MKSLRHPASFVSIIAAPLLVCLCLTGIASRALGQSEPSQPSCGGPEYRQFDFWVGDWEVRTAKGDLAGTNRIEKALNDCVLIENWRGSKGSAGKSFNMYYARDETWRQTWVDANGGRLDLLGGLDGEDMVLSGEMPGPDGKTVRHEIRWTPLEDGRVRQHWRIRPAGEQQWQDAFLGFYSQKNPDSTGNDGRGNR